MKFTIKRDLFFQALTQVGGVVGSKATLPLLSNVHIEAKEGGVTVTATDLDFTASATVAADIKKVGVGTFPAHRLAQIVRELPTAELSFDVNPATTRATVRSGQSTFQISGIDANEYPKLRPLESASASIELPQKAFLDLLKTVEFAQSADEARYILNGVYFELAADGLKAVATDGRRLALGTLALPKDSGRDGRLILPRKAVTLVAGLLGSGKAVRFQFDSRRIEFRFDTDKAGEGFVGEMLLASKLVEGNYPNYQQVIPATLPQKVTIERELLRSALHRAALVCTDKSRSAKLQFESGRLAITAKSTEFGEANEDLVVKYDGPSLQICFDPEFLMKPLAAIAKDEVTLELKDETSAGVLRSEAFVYVVMPIRLS